MSDGKADNKGVGEMNINCKLFRLSTYRPHEVTGEPPKREMSFISYRSGDHGGRQLNYSLKVGLTVCHLKLRLALHRAESQLG